MNRESFSIDEEAVLIEHRPLTAELFEGTTLPVTNHLTDQELNEMAADIRPSSRQLRFVERGIRGFIHFSVNTFSKNEWGSGEEDINVFNPSRLDCRQWARTFRSAGITNVTLVAKHHDGFCLWPSRHTDHCVKKSSWRNGTGDVVKEFVHACHAYNLAVGIYYSPWDMHEETYGTEAYNDYMIAQLKELLTHYGPVEDIWFDGAGQDEKVSGTYMAFDWPRIYAAIRECQPRGGIDGGTDTRWIGNESGKGRQTQWSVQSVNQSSIFQISSHIHGLNLKDETLGKTSDLRKGKMLHWLQARGGTPTRAGWFWHKNTDHTVRTLKDMVDIYFSTAGNNSPIQYNLAPDDRGLIADGEVNLFAAFGRYLTRLYERDYATNAVISASTNLDDAHEANRLLEQTPYTDWTAAKEAESAEIIISLPARSRFNVIKLQENIRDRGQRISRFTLYINGKNKWHNIYEGTTVGYRRLIRLDTLETDKIKIQISESRREPSLSRIAMFYAPMILTPPKISRNEEGQVCIESGYGHEVRYTLDGSSPAVDGIPYTKPFSLIEGGIVREKAIGEEGEESESTIEFGWLSKNWTVKDGTGSESDGNIKPENLLLPDPLLCWKASDKTGGGDIIIDMKESHNVIGFSYLPAQKKYKGMIIPDERGLIRYFSFFVSPDGIDWSDPLLEGEFGNIANNPVRQTIKAESKSKRGRFIKFCAVESVEGTNEVRASELQILCSSEKKI